MWRPTDKSPQRQAPTMVVVLVCDSLLSSRSAFFFKTRVIIKRIHPAGRRTMRGSALGRSSPRHNCFQTADGASAADCSGGPVGRVIDRVGLAAHFTTDADDLLKQHGQGCERAGLLQQKRQMRTQLCLMIRFSTHIRF